MDADARRRLAARDLVREAIKLSDQIPELLDRKGQVDVSDAAPDLREAVISLHNRLLRVELGLQMLLNDDEAVSPPR